MTTTRSTTTSGFSETGNTGCGTRVVIIVNGQDSEGWDRMRNLENEHENFARRFGERGALKASTATGNYLWAIEYLQPLSV